MPADYAYAATAAGVVLCGPAAYLLGPWLMRRIPEPELDEGETKIPYADLAGRSAARWCGGTAAAAGGALGWGVGFSPVLPALLALAVVGAVLGYVDSRTRYLPSPIIWPSYLVVGSLLVIGSAASGQWSALGRAVLAGAVGFVVFYLMWYVYPRGIGFGDVRLSGLLSMALGWLGWGEVVTGLYGGFFLGAVLGIALTLARVFRRKELFPFGPFMLVGAVIGVLAGGPLAAAYLG